MKYGKMYIIHVMLPNNSDIIILVIPSYSASIIKHHVHANVQARDMICSVKNLCIIFHLM